MSAARPLHTDAELRARVRAVGLRATRGRVRVYSHLLDSQTPRSHQDVVEALADHSFDRASVYRNLTDLTRVGLLRRFDVGDHVWRFEPAHRAAPVDEHAHFVCTDCGNVVCLPGIEVDVPIGAPVPAAVVRHQVEVQLRGVCDACS
ncbi:MAG: transcriptional repressor [Myxococcales bacterium]|nr:transcriptional repressor [Myxococcales bacterium]